MSTVTTVAMTALVAATINVYGTPSSVCWSIAGQVVDYRAQSQSAQGSSNMITIDGSKNPELLPEWLVWQQTLETLALIEHKDAPAFKHDLVLSDAERVLVYREASQQPERERKCFASLDQRHKELSAAGVKPDVMQKDLEDREVECRWKVLEARDRILGGLSPEAQASLLSWIGGTRAAIRITVSREGLAHFKRPQ